MQEMTKKERKAVAREERRQAEEDREKSAGVKKYAVWLVVAVLVVLGGYRLIRWINTPTGTSSTVSGVQEREGDQVKGAQDAKVTMVEYGDYQCPACSIFNPEVKKLVEEYGNDLRVIYRHFPLPSHPLSVPTAKAAEAAGKQGKFWEMHDLIYARQSEWSEEENIVEKLNSYAEELELEMEQFKQDFESDAVKDKVNSDLISANQLRLDSTPTFFLNGEKMDLTKLKSYDEFKALVTDKINNQ